MHIHKRVCIHIMHGDIVYIDLETNKHIVCSNQ